MTLKNFATCDCPCHQGVVVRGLVCHVVPCCDAPGKVKLNFDFVRKILRRARKHRRRD